MTRIVAICSQKGGVGKTSTAVSLGAFLNLARQQTLIVDLDPQGNATSGLSVSPPDTAPLRTLLQNPHAWQEVTSYTSERNLFLVPSTVDVDFHVDLDGISPQQVTAIRDGLLNHEDPAYDFVLIDSPPTIGPLSLLALQLADTVLIPVQCEYYAMEGLSQMLPLVEMVQRVHGRKLTIEGLLLTMFDEELDLSYEVAQELRAHFPDETLETIIPRDVAIAECASHGIPISEYEPRSRGAWAYLNLAKEIMDHVSESEKTRTGLGLAHQKERRSGIRRQS